MPDRWSCDCPSDLSKRIQDISDNVDWLTIIYLPRGLIFFEYGLGFFFVFLLASVFPGSFAIDFRFFAFSLLLIGGKNIGLAFCSSEVAFLWL